VPQTQFRFAWQCQPVWPIIPGSLRQHGGCVSNQQREVMQLKTNKILNHVYLLQAQHQIHLKSVYVASHNNISDALSHGAIKEFLASFPNVNTQASIPLPSHLADKLVSL
jgi:hypothetical protein